MITSYNFRIGLEKVKGAAVHLGKCSNKENSKAERLNKKKGIVCDSTIWVVESEPTISTTPSMDRIMGNS